MQERPLLMHPTPMLPEPCYRTLLKAVSIHFVNLLSTWDAWSAATERFTAEQRSQGQGLLTFLFGHLSEVATQEPAFIHGFLKVVSGLNPPLSTADVVLVLSDFEELLLSVVRAELPNEDQEPVYHWVHSLAAKLVQAQLRLATAPNLDESRTTIGSTLAVSSPSSNTDGFLTKLLTFDEHLLAAREASEVFHTVVTDSCGLAGFHRSALFLYNPLTKTAEGVYAHNIQLDEVRRIRENDRRIPLLPAVLQIPKPVYIEDVTAVLPMHYVTHFRLTSLLVCPVRGQHGQPVGVLLVDEGGQPFTADSTRIDLVEQMVKRASLALGLHLQSTRSTPIVNRRSLTDRELEVLRRIADGCGTKSIADQLHISEHTVTEHVTSILRKLRANNRASAVAKAFRAGLIR